MKAIILASGIGKRLLPLTKKTAKPLIKLNGKSIIERQIDSILKFKINEIIVTTGPFTVKIMKLLKEKYRDAKITFVQNPQYDTTNYIYSLWLTKDHITEDVLLLHGDLVFDEKVLAKIVKAKGNSVLVNKSVKKPEKDFKAIIENGLVKKIGVEYFTDNSYFSIPIYKISKKDFLLWMHEIEKEIKNGNLNIYAEDAFNKISEEIKLKPVYFKDEVCMEIDTKEDLKIAKTKLKD